MYCKFTIKKQEEMFNSKVKPKVGKLLYTRIYGITAMTSRQLFVYGHWVRNDFLAPNKDKVFNGEVGRY